MNFFKNLALTLAVFLIPILMTISLSKCTHPVRPHSTKVDTARVWLYYFKEVGKTYKDTTTFSIRLTQDVHLADSTWKRDTIYYVPYDSIKVDTGGKRFHDTIMYLLPKGWEIMDYNKTVVPLYARPG